DLLSCGAFAVNFQSEDPGGKNTPAQSVGKQRGPRKRNPLAGVDIVCRYDLPTVEERKRDLRLGLRQLGNGGHGTEPRLIGPEAVGLFVTVSLVGLHLILLVRIRLEIEQNLVTLKFFGR